MSKSRLEKFLYALYSLDSSDLPTPLSRIEELYKCWVTGEEAPTFKPLSRVEKYLMVILGLYDLETQVEQRVLCTENNDVIVDENENYICLDEVTSGGIPAPISRIEKLLYKLATGDDNLDDVKSFLSEHEELLAEIIRNGGVGGNIDIEYVLHTLSTEFNTLYNTAEKPVKSAILTGQTLVNLLKVDNKYLIATIGASDFDIQTNKSVKTTIKDATTANLYPVVYFKDYSMFKANTKYLALFNDLGTNDYVSQISVRSFTGGGNIADKATSKKLARGKILFTTRENLSDVVNRQAIILETGNRSYNSGDIIHIENVRVFEYQEGMENWDIPYFEGMQSVKMPVLTTTGKNLFDNKFKTSSYASEKAYFPNGTMTSVAFPHTTTNISRGIAAIIKVKPDTSYTVTISNHPEKSVILGSGYENIDDMSTASNAVLTVGSVGNDTITTRSFTTTSDCNYMVIGCYAKYEQNTTNIITFNEAPHIQLEEGSEATEYEHHESTTVTYEGVELRGIGDVKDELDLVTGELTQRIGEFVFDGDERFKMSTSDNNAFFYHELGGDMLIPSFTKKMISNNLLDYANYATMKNTENSMYTNGKSIYIHLTNDINSVSLLQTYLANNPIKIITCLSNESVKTVDLSVVDQDGNDTELSTFDGLTHVTLSSEGLIPEAELEVATKNEEVLSTLSLEMDDISTSQNTLEETANTQSENVDATMIATTEIYEGLL